MNFEAVLTLGISVFHYRRECLCYRCNIIPSWDNWKQHRKTRWFYICTHLLDSGILSEVLFLYLYKVLTIFYPSYTYCVQKFSSYLYGNLLDAFHGKYWKIFWSFIFIWKTSSTIQKQHFKISPQNSCLLVSTFYHIVNIKKYSY